MQIPDDENLEKAAAEGDAESQFTLAAACHLGGNKDIEEAVKWYTLAAEQGHTQAQFNLAMMYFVGEDVPKDFDITAKWLKLAAEQGEAASQNALAVLYFNGQGVEKNHDEAIKWWKRSANNGNASAQISIGAMHYDGKGVEKDMVQALMWHDISILNGSEDGKKNRDILEKEATPEQIALAKKRAAEWLSHWHIRQEDKY